MTASDDRIQGQGTVVALAIAMILLLSVIATLTMVFELENSQNNSQLANETSERTETLTHTDYPDPTQSVNPTLTQLSSLTATPSPTEPPSPISSETSVETPVSTQTVSPTSDPFTNEKYSDFVATVFGEAEVDSELPLRIRGWEVVEGKVLIVAMNLTSPSRDGIRRMRQVNTLVTSGYGQAIFHHDNGNIDGKIPNRLRIAEVNNTGLKSRTLHVNTSLVRDYYIDNINAPEFTKRLWETQRNMSVQEERYVRKMDKNGGNITLYNRTIK